MKKKLAIATIAIIILLFFALDLHHWLSLEQLKQQQSALLHWRDQSPLLAIALFFVAYIAVTALSLPGAAIMTLAAGAFFDVLAGTVIVSFASSIGATLAFLISRYLFRDTVEKRFSSALETINAGIEKEGAFYLFTLRLVPLFPFFMINILMGITALKTRTFYWVSQVGMLAGTLVYVNAGSQLANITSTRDILSPALLLSFTLLGLFPWLAKRIVRHIQQQRVYKGWKEPRTFDRNLVVIGAGAAGLVTAYIAATVKAKVTLIEKHKMGGDCLNYGCVPSKALIRSAKLAHQIRHADRYGLRRSDTSIDVEGMLDFKAVMQRVQAVIAQVAPHDSAERYTSLGVEVLQGHGTIIDPWTVEISHTDGTKQRITSRNLVIATGARPFVPPLPGIATSGYLTSDTLWDHFATLDHPPQRIVVLGGGPIGCELAQALARLGSHVTQVEMADRLMNREDPDVSTFVKNTLQADGITVLTGHKALKIEDKKLIAECDGKQTAIAFDELVCAVGRSARLDGFGLEALGIPAQRTVTTNAYLETLFPNIFAAGDVAGPYQFTHTAAHMAWYAAVNALFGGVKKFKVDYRVIPWTTFVDPEVARVGINEQEAREKNIPYEVTRYELDDLDRAIADSAEHGFVKVLSVPGSDRILGVTIVGEHAGDLLAEFVLAMKHGLGLNKILSTIHTYPTWAEANKYVAGEWKKSHAPTLLLSLAERYHRWQRQS